MKNLVLVLTLAGCGAATDGAIESDKAQARTGTGGVTGSGGAEQFASGTSGAPAITGGAIHTAGAGAASSAEGGATLSGGAPGGSGAEAGAGAGGNQNCEIQKNDHSVTTCSALFSGTATCIDGVCTQCTDGQLDCDGSSANRCEVTMSDANCGSCLHQCLADKHCIRISGLTLCQ
jgi:hypothetical protein